MICITLDNSSFSTVAQNKDLFDIWCGCYENCLATKLHSVCVRARAREVGGRGVCKGVLPLMNIMLDCHCLSYICTYEIYIRQLIILKIVQAIFLDLPSSWHLRRIVETSSRAVAAAALCEGG
jgi:hypothetical protein